MKIRKSILFSYVVLVSLVVVYSLMLVLFSGIKNRIDIYADNLSQIKDVWNELLISMNDLEINWADGFTFKKFREKSEHLDTSLYGIVENKPLTISFLHYDSSTRETALYNTWLLARGSIFRIIELVEGPEFQRVVSRLEKQPGLQRLNHLWNVLYYKPGDEGKKDAYAIRQIIDIIEFFPIYSETINHLFNVTIHETDVIKNKLEKIQWRLSILFFILFLTLYMILALRFSKRISTPIITLSMKLSLFMGKTLKMERYSHTNELKILTLSVENLIEHYTHLANITKQLAVGDLNSSVIDLAEQGVVGGALKEVTHYLKELMETSQLIKDGHYGAEVTVKSEKDILAVNFNIMSKVILEKITTLSNMFEAVEESILVVDYEGNLLEANNNLLHLIGLESLSVELLVYGPLNRFIPNSNDLKKIYQADKHEEIFTHLNDLNGESLPVKIVSKKMPQVSGQREKVMLFITNESLRVRAEREKQNLRAQAVEAELKALRAQINSHFLFNTLNGIAHLVESNSHEAVSMIEKLAEIFRYSLVTTRHRTVQIYDVPRQEKFPDLS